ncbi:hypothetical protein [Bordetella sp. 2513F-2]
MPLANSLFFVHIPKTAGTSLRLALEDALGKEHICYDYGPESPVTDPDVKKVGYPTADLFRLERLLARKQCKLLAGHVNALQYMPMMYVTQTFTFIRNPVNQLLSHYEHHVRHYGYQEPLEVFIRKPIARHRFASHMLKGVPLEALGFVGVTEQYEASIALLARQYELEIPVRYDNRNPALADTATYAVPESLQVEIEEILKPEYELWHRAQALLKARGKAIEEGYRYTHGAIHSMTAHSISGFAFSPGSSIPVRVSVEVNGQSLSRTVFATAHRPSLGNLHVPRNACVGFDIRLPRPLKSGDIVRCSAIETGQVLDERCVLSPASHSKATDPRAI